MRLSLLLGGTAGLAGALLLAAVHAYPFPFGSGFSGGVTPPPPPPPPPGIVTTFTMKNNGSTTMAAGSMAQFGQGFARGDFPAGTYPVVRDATTHTPLVQQLDEIATRRENSDDGSIRHLVWSIQLPQALPPGGLYTVEFFRQSGTYSAVGKQSLAALCAAHDLRIVYSDVRNQDDTVRDTGTMISRVCDNVSNVGRDAPRHVRAGPVADTWIVRGPPIYSGSGNKDPLIYTEWTLDLTTDPNDQTSLGPVRHVALTMNSWMNVRAGSAGNAGAPGPVGLANDPQVVSYRPALLDGSSTLIDWSWYDKTIPSSSNPILLNGTPYISCGAGSTGFVGVNGQWTIPGSLGQNAWYHSMAVRYTTDGTPPAGMTANRIYFVNAAGLQYTNQDPNNAAKIYLARIPSVCTSDIPDVIPTTQGTGNQIFSFRIWHHKHDGWWSWAQDAKENWTNGTARVVSNLYPALTSTEQSYWKKTGSMLPFIHSPGYDYTSFNYVDYNAPFYTPLGLGMMGGGGGGGERSTLGTMNDFIAAAFTEETQLAWDRARLAANSTSVWPFILSRDEATGRIPIYNNGPPAANHGGSGLPYMDGSTTLSPHPGSVFWSCALMDGFALPRENTPEPLYPFYCVGNLTKGTGQDHIPSFINGWYQIHGGRQALQAIYDVANRSIPSIPNGDLPALHQTSTIAGVRYYGLHNSCCQIRGAYWVHRDATVGAAYGADSNIERTYYNDILEENYWQQLAFEDFTNGSGGNFSGLFTTPYNEFNPSTFKNSYGHTTMSQSWALLRDPLSAHFIPRFVQEHLTRCSDTVPNSYSSYYCGGFNWGDNIRDATHLNDCDSPTGAGVPMCPNTGQYYANDASENGEETDYWCWGGDTWTPQGNHGMLASDGDKVKNPQAGQHPEGVLGSPSPDQLSDRAFWYSLANVVHNAGGGVDSFKIINPATGTPFTQYTNSGTPSTGCMYLKLRPTNPADSLPTGAFSGYTSYAISAQKFLLSIGRSDILPALNKQAQRGNEQRPEPKLHYDQSVVIP